MNLRTNPELLPIIEWWEKDGKSTLAIVLVAALAVGGFYGYKAHRAAARAAAAEAVASAFTIEELEVAATQFAGTSAEGVLRVRLAKSYYDGEKYDTALEMYTDLITKPVKGLEGVAEVGKAQCLEALKRYDEAIADYDRFATASGNEKSPYKLTAELGVARCLALKGDQKSALEKLSALKAAAGEEGLTKARIESAEDLVKRIIR